jgi:nucleotide-binding universal stress UspA family protein
MFSKIVVGTNGSDTAQKAVERALGLALQSDASVHLVIAYKTSALVGGDAWFPAKNLEAHDQAEDAVKRAAAEVLAEAVADAREVKIETHVVRGTPDEVVVNVAEEVGADLIVVGSRGMQGAHRLIGSVPNAIAHHAPCDVMIVKTT